MPSTESLPMPSPKLPVPPREQAYAWSRRRVVLWLGMIAVLVLVYMLWSLSEERRAIRAMEPQARAALFDETMRGFQTLCSQDTNSALLSRCRSQARFLRAFPECDAACRQQTAPFEGGFR